MSNERKAVLFEGAMRWIYKELEYADADEFEYALKEMGFNEEETRDILAQAFSNFKEE